MKTIPITSIRISPERQRRYFDAAKLQELSDGIQKRGLLNPILLRQVDSEYYLVAGERRLRAIADIYGLGGCFTHDGELVSEGEIPYTLFSDLDPLAQEEAELEENIHRVDLSWQERAAACARIADLRNRQALARGEASPTTAEIALEVRGSSEGVNQETTRREIIVSRYLDNPEVREAKSVDEAFKILRKQETATKRKTLGESVGRSYTANALRAYNNDSLQMLQDFESALFDVIITDPPYGMNADSFGDSGGLAAGGHGYKDSPEIFQAILEVLPEESFRITKEQAHLYVFCDIDWFMMLREAFRDAGWNVFRTPLIWYKKSGMRAPWPEQGPQRKYETILYAVKGKRPVLKMGGDVLDFSSDSNLGHAAQKPVALFAELLRRSALPGDSVLDPFMGSGTIFAAAHELKLHATGIELDTTSYGIAIERLNKLKASEELDNELGL